jgi:TonB family protein
LNYALLISFILHLALFTYLFIGGNNGGQQAYPRIMTVDLVSLPPISRGVPSGTESPGQAEAAKAKAQTKVEPAPQNTHLAEVEKKKRPAAKKPEPKPAVSSKKNENAEKPKNASQQGIPEPQYGLPEGVDFGSEFGTVQLEGASFETPTYLNILFAKIKNRWDNPFQGVEKIVCTIYFTILRNGDIVDAAIEQSSGVTAFDQSALRAVLSSRPPPLPLEYSGEQLGIHLQFQYLP